VEAADAGVASGLLNTTQQIGGAVGLAAASTIATTFTTRYVDAHPGSSPLGAEALTHGFNIAFYALAGVAALAAVLAVVLIEPHAAPAEEAEFEAIPIEEAA
jgi:sugar phosphate permease